MTLQIVRLDRWIDPCFDEMIQAHPGVKLSIIETDSPMQDNLALMARTDLYHTTASRGETPLHWHITPELLKSWPRLKVVSSTGAGYDTIDVQACTDAGVLVVNQSGANADSVAEHALGMMLTLLHRISESDHVLRTYDRRVAVTRESLMGRELRGKTLGLVGIGEIGQRVARLAKAFGVRVLATDPYLEDAQVEQRGALRVPLAQLLAESDVISVHCPRNQETEYLFNAELFQAMKPNSVFISTARGGIHDEQALYEALVSGHLSAAGVDVWDPEPPVQDHPLLTLPNVLASFHTAGVTHEARHNVARLGAEQLLQICRGETPPRMVNPEVLDRVMARFASEA